jgi:hydrogenase expression/formation protein HypC
VLVLAKIIEVNMCLAIPAKVVEILEDNKCMVDVGGVRKDISTSLVEDVKIGDYVIIHMGYALNKLDEDEAQKTLALFAEAYEKLGISK